MAAYERPQQAPGDRGIIKVDKKHGRWEAIPVALINDRRLGLDTLGLAVWLISRPENWQVHVSALPRLLASTSASTKRIGREKSRRMLRELQKAGYLKRTRTRDSHGRWLWHSVFSAVPQTSDGLAVDGSTVAGSATGGKPVDLSQTSLTPNRFITNGLQSRAERKKAEEIRLAELRRARDCGPPRAAGELAQRYVQTLSKSEKPSST